jgi:O-antigen/teichoic acid export membrane protein
LADSYSVGLFGGPYRLLLAVRLLSMILVLPLYPGLVRLAKDSLAAFWVSYERALKWLICMSLPGAIVFLFTPAIVIKTLLGAKFLAATPALQWFGLAFVPMFVSALFPYVYAAIGRQRVFFAAMGVTLILRLVLELWLIPKFGYMSACVIAVGCEIIPFAAFIVLLGWGRFTLSPLNVFVKPAFAAAVMGGVLFLGRPYLGERLSFAPTLLLYFAAGTAYLVALFFTRPFSKEEISLAKEAAGFLGPYLRSVRRKPETP